MMIDRRTFSTGALAAGLGAALASRGAFAATASTPATAPVKARNVVLVHGLFADGSSWSEVIGRLQARGLNVTSVQNPLTSLADAVAETKRVLDRQDGPTVLAGHSFSGMIVTEAGVHPNVSALVYVARARPMRARIMARSRRSSPPRRQARASSMTATRGGSMSRPSCTISPATCRRRRRRSSMRCSSPSTRRCSPIARRRRHGAPGPASMPSPRRIARSTRIWSASWRSAWARGPSSSARAMSRSSPIPERSVRSFSRRLGNRFLAARFRRIGWRTRPDSLGSPSGAGRASHLQPTGFFRSRPPAKRAMRPKGRSLWENCL